MVYPGDEGKYAIIMEKTSYYRQYDWYIVSVTKFNRVILRQDKSKLRPMLRVMHCRHVIVDENKTKERGLRRIPADPQQFLLAEDITRYALRDRQVFYGRKNVPDRPGKGFLSRRIGRIYTDRAKH